MKTLDLDVAVPEDTPKILRAAAGHYRASWAELAAAWQDHYAGEIWNDYAKILERAAASMERARRRRGL